MSNRRYPSATVDTTWAEVRLGDILPGVNELESCRVVRATVSEHGVMVTTRPTYIKGGRYSRFHSHGPVTVTRIDSVSTPRTVCRECRNAHLIDGQGEPVVHLRPGTGQRCGV